MKYKIAVLIPCYNEEESIAELYKRLKAAFNKFKKKIDSYSIYFISDGSTDNTVKEVKKVMKNDSNVELLDLKKSGKSIALQVGFSAIKDDVDLVFMMDGDLQDDPKEIGRFIEKIESGYDLVSGYKKIRLDNLEKRTASKVYNKSLNIIFRMNLHDHNCGFKCFKKEVVDKLKIYDNLHRFITVLVNDMGYKVGEIDVEHHKRMFGKSKYGLVRYFIGLKDALRIKFILSHKSWYSYTKDIIINGIILALAFFINRNLFLIVCIFLIAIYVFFIYNIRKYKKFSLDIDSVKN